MSDYFLAQREFEGFIEQLLQAIPVIAPVQKKSKFVFESLKSCAELRLDYDVTLLPPKTVFFPVKQELLKFNPQGAMSSIHPVNRVLLGVHFYDIKAIDQLDQLFEEGRADNNYLANRRATIIIGSNIQRVSSRAFFGSVGQHVQPQGQDAFLTKINGGYLYAVVTKKGDSLRRHGKFVAANAQQIEEARQINEEVLNQCPESLAWSSDLISVKVRNAFSDKQTWEELSKDCFSCGGCNIVCPTCYCFDVQDRWNLDQVSGTRARTWDACMTKDFAKVSLGTGGEENFRERKAQRFRHRVMRKAAYLNEKLGGPACVGCGRCAIGCVPDIADPVRIIQRIMFGAKSGGQDV